MYTRPAARGRGVGKALLRQIASEAQAAKKPMLRLETGTEQAEAIALYRGAGFTACGPFGPYAEMEPHRIATSLFYEKRL
jgi:putative acetyltransferase